MQPQSHPTPIDHFCQQSVVAGPPGLRPYQAAAVEATERYLATDTGNPCIVLPTGAGKSHVIAALARNAIGRGDRVLVLAHVKELLQQAHEKLSRVCGEVGLYSAGLGQRDTSQNVLVAGVQSVAHRAGELGRFGLIVVDESHLIPPDGEGRYRKLIAGCRDVNPDVRVVGLTATPYRMSSGPICGPESILTDVVYEASVSDLISDGYLSPLVSRSGVVEPDFDQLHIRGGEFRDSEVAALMDTVVDEACREIVALTFDRRACLVFSSGVEHGDHVTQSLRRLGVTAEFITGQTSSTDRDRIVSEFKSGGLRYLVNVNVLTTGFDAPHIDCVAMLRPTMSPGLYYQMVGRGLRTAPGKSDCLVLDYAGNVRRHGPIDAIAPDRKPTKRGNAPVKVCPECRRHLPANLSGCECGFEFTSRSRTRHSAEADVVGLLSTDPIARAEQLIEKTHWKGIRLVRDADDLRCFPRRRVPAAILDQLSRSRDEFLALLESAPVHQVSYREHVSSRGTTSLMVGYRSFDRWFNEWVHFGASGRVGRLAELWWKDSGGDAPAPTSAADALLRVEELSRPNRVTTAPNGKYRRVTGWR